jgi:uncharacterized protein (TIGR02594 family)
MATLTEKAFEIAKRALKEDWREVDGPKSNPKILAVYKCVDGLGNPEMLDDSKVSWCSCFVNYCIQRAGGKGTRSALARSWLQWGVESAGDVGDVVILRRGTSSWQGHVGFVFEQGKLTVKVLAGNQGNNVTVKTFFKAMVLGYRKSKF